MNLLRRQTTFGLLAFGAAAVGVRTQGAAAVQQAMQAGLSLGTSAAIDRQGRLWIARAEAAHGAQLSGKTQAAFVVLQMSTDMGKTWSSPRRIQSMPEGVEASGESRPKVVFGDKDQVYVTYTKPLAKPYTGEIRFVRSVDGGQTFSAPVTVHKNRDLITHRFDSMVVDKTGRLYIAWIDKRDVEAAKARKEKYAGAAVYYAVSDDGGSTFKGDYKLADHSCECCRIALALDARGRPVALWRHVFEPNVRDHAIAVLAPDGTVSGLQRVTFEDWRIDACPHHGPALAYGADGTRHQVWFNVKGDEGGVFYASTAPSGELETPVRLGSGQAQHGDVAVKGRNVAVVWKEFDGQATAIMARLSGDGGRTWRELVVAKTEGNSDHPHLVQSGAGGVLVWRTQDQGIQTVPIFSKN
jgi:hypothetical protein